MFLFPDPTGSVAFHILFYKGKQTPKPVSACRHEILQHRLMETRAHIYLDMFYPRVEKFVEPGFNHGTGI
jgi:hypothetical protein